jgi:hypothetical protein
MKKTIHKWFWVWDFEKEEAWLNKMAEQGLHLCGVGLCKYTFEEGAPGEYTIRLEMLEKLPGNIESIQYIRFIEETGAEHIGSFFRWVFFRKKAGGEGFDLFSDIDSRIKHLNRILLLIGILSIINLYNSINNLIVFYTAGFSANKVVSIMCFLVFGLLGYGFVRLYLKRRRLKKEKILHE